ncbi:MAG: hypothetical protein J6W51_08750 [Fibrobacter sp.]|nr:hypothetical protein [Fibrobacter sp.]
MIDFARKLNETLRKESLCLAYEFDKDNCEGAAILSHSIARSRQLAKIAENDKVCVWNNDAVKLFHLMDESGGTKRSVFEPLSTRKASAFRGFCNYHDTLLFDRIDNPIAQFDKETVLQLHYRSVSYEYFHKKKAIDCINDFLNEPMSRKNPLYNWACDYLEIMHLSLSDIQKQKQICEKSYPTKNVNGDVKAVIFEFDVSVPVMCVGGWIPTYTINRKKDCLKTN